jgi:hypothetical protein
MSPTRTAAACLEDAIKPEPKLRDFIERAIAASDAARDHLMRDDPFEWTQADEAEQDRLDTAEFEARQHLLNHLLFEHGVGMSLVRRLGDVL